MKYLFPLLIFFLVISCTPVENRKAIEQIDSLLVVNERLQDELNTSDIDTFRMIYDTVVKYNAFFRKEGLPELSKEDLDIIYHYGTIDKTFKKFLNNHRGDLIRRLEHRENQLITLKHDISKKILKPEEFNKYLHTEDSIMRFLTEDIEGRLEFAYSHKDKFNIYHDKVLVLIEKIEKEVADKSN
jgi:hypothetical protein